MNPRYSVVASRAGHRCEYCHAPEAIFNFPFEVEHVIPPNHAGPDVADNWALACRSCNLFKGDRLDALDPETETRSPLFHPRRDTWDEHFAVDADSSAIVGRSQVGRGTISCLRMNASSQIFARQQWMRLGLFP